MSESASQRSGDASETSSQAADRSILKKRRNNGRDGVDGEEDDLLEQKKSLQEGIYSAMYMLARSKSADSWTFAAIKVVLEGLIPFLVVFNPTNDWDVHTSNPVWQVVRWALPRSPIARIWGYDVYIRVFFAIMVVVYLTVACIAILTVAMRRKEHSKALKRFARVLQLMTEVVFTLSYMSVFDYMMFLFNCEFTGSHGSHPHAYWPEVECLETPHLIYMILAGVTALVFFCTTAVMLVAGCDLSPVAGGIMASPAAVTRLRVLGLKAVYVIAINTLAVVAKVQAVVVVVAAGGITYFNFIRLPFLRPYINCLWVGDWAAVVYTCVIFNLLEFGGGDKDPVFNDKMVDLVLYGVFPSYVAGALATWVWYTWRMRPTRKFLNLDPAVKLKKVHEFGSPDEVELLTRSMRQFDIDGIVYEEAALLGETVIKCGMAVFPNQVELLVLYANYLMEVKRDGPAARTQLQLALKAGPSVVQRYGIFSTIENSKRLRDGQEGSLDLQSYVEFKRNYRAVIRVHKAALSAQREFWQLLQRPSVRVSGIEAMLREMDDTADTAHQVYKRVLERYPNNGKLLRCYGKFLEDVRNDPTAAARAYAEAARNGGGDGLLSLDLQIQGGDKPEFITTMDLHEDACIVINAEGTILMVNSCVTTLLGYPKTELEGANVSIIMPQPFSGRHPSYLSRYAQGGEPHILDTVRDVVALHKERHVFPLQICVTKLSGVGTDAIFLGLLRPQPLDARNVRAWVAPNGVILCTDPQFASLTGLLTDDMVGCNFQNLCTDIAAVEALLEICKDAPYESLVAGQITRELHIMHRHLPPVPVEVKVTPGGTDSQRIFVFNARRTDGNADGLMVVDPKGALTFSTWDVAAMLGYPLDKFLRMKLDQLLPLPFSTMHVKYLKDVPPVVPATSCRAGCVVNFMNSNGANVPVRLAVATQEDSHTGKTKHIVQVKKLDPSAAHSFHDRRLVLTVTMAGDIVGLDNRDSFIFGFPASRLLGSNLVDCIDVFTEWRSKAGASQMELLMLSLLDREFETPGSSWRVKVHNPEGDESLPNIDRSAPPRHASGKSAVMQAEIVETSAAEEAGAGGAVELGGRQQEALRSLARITLWRRDLLTGVLELDDHLVVRKADNATSLIVGRPPSSLVRTPLSKILDVPKGVPWEELMRDKRRAARKKSAMKGAAEPVVSPVQAFEGPHPDGGTMRVFLQGVSGGGNSRIYVTMHPDTTFTGNHANIYQALGLDALLQARDHHLQEQQHQHQHQQPQQHPAGAPTAAFADSAAGVALPKASAASAASARATEASAAAAGHAAARAGPKATTLAAAGAAAATADEELSARDGGSERGRHSARGEEEEDEEEGRGRWEREASVSSSSSSSSSNDDDGSDDPDEDRERGSEDSRGGSGRGRRRKQKRRTASDEGGGGEDEEVDPEHLHKTARNQSDFVAQWVRTLARQMTGVAADPAADRDLLPLSRAASRLPSRAGSDAAADPPGPSRRGSGASAAATADAPGPSRRGSGTSAAATADVLGPSRRGSGASGGEWARGNDGSEGGWASGSVAGGPLGRKPSSGVAFALARRPSGIQRQRLDPVEEEDGEEGSGGGGGRSRDGQPLRTKRSGLSRGPSRALSRGLSRGGGGGGSGGLDGPEAAGEGSGEDGEQENKEGDSRPGSSQNDNEDACSVVDDDDAASQGLGPNFTDAASAVDVDLATDARRARLLKKLSKVLFGPQLSTPLARLKLHTWGLLATMIVTHVVIYVIFISLIEHQFSNIREVHRLALAADRAQLVTVKAVVAEFCTRPGIEPVAICEHPLERTLAELRAAVEDLELYHQTTYLGLHNVPRKPQDPTVYYLWTDRTTDYKVYYDTQPSMWSNETSGVWQLGNRFIATARELLYWGKEKKGRIGDLRATKFVVTNGPWGLFDGYTSSLSYLVNYAWQEVATLQRALIIMLVVEAAFIQLVCVLYEFWLIRQVEVSRMAALLSGLGIPGPMLRVLASRPVVVVEDSDDEDADEDEAGGEGAGGGGGGGGGVDGASGRQDDDDEDWKQFTAGAATGNTDGASARPRYRRMSMDMAPPAPGAALPLGPGPGPGGDYDVGPGGGAGGGSSEAEDAPAVFAGGRSRGPSLTNLSAGAAGGGSGGRGGGGGGGGAIGGFGGHSLAAMTVAAKRGTAGGVRAAGGGRVAVNGKELIPSRRIVFKFMLPLLLWEIALVIVGTVSYVRLEGMQGPLASLNMASHVIYRYTRVRAVALMLVAGVTAADREFYRGHLRTELANLQSEYDTLMYGGLAITQVGSVFQKPVPASTFESSSFSANFFREERCFRWDQSLCYPPGSPYYEVTHHGLDVMLRRIISEMTLLASDDDADATYNGTRYSTMYYVGTKDLYEGLQSSAQLFVDYSISRYNSIKLLQTILLVVTIVFLLLYGLLLVRPYQGAIEAETTRLAGLLSHVPAELDVIAHVRQILRSYGKLRQHPHGSGPGPGWLSKWVGRSRRKAAQSHGWGGRGAGGGGGGASSAATSRVGSRATSRTTSRATSRVMEHV